MGCACRPCEKDKNRKQALFRGGLILWLAEVIDNTTSRGRTLRFLYDGSYEDFRHTLFSVGEIPLPKWIREKPEEIDYERFHTIYAKNEGAVATPAAGLHFSRELFKRMEIKGVGKRFSYPAYGAGGTSGQSMSRTFPSIRWIPNRY